MCLSCSIDTSSICVNKIAYNSTLLENVTIFFLRANSINNLPSSNYRLIRGVPRIWQGGGGARIFFQIWPCALLGRFGGMLPRENFLKWCNLVRFGVYFDQILSLNFFKNYHFLYKKFKNCIFLYKRINILDTRNIILVKIFFEKFMIDAFWYLF